MLCIFPVHRCFCCLLITDLFCHQLPFLEWDIDINVCSLAFGIKKQKLSLDSIFSRRVTKQDDSEGNQNSLDGNHLSKPTKEPLMLSRSLEKRKVCQY